MRKTEGEANRKYKLEDLQIGKTIGRGGFGKVKIAKVKTQLDKQKSRHQQDKQDKYVALKILKKQQIMKAQQLDHIHNQNNIHSQLSHPFIVNFQGFAQDTRYLYFIMQLINGGQLHTYLRSNSGLPSQQCKFYSALTVLCIQYLHNKDIIYRDLKPQNLLIASDGYLKLTDFGFAKILNKGRTFTICGTPQYVAPEIILNQGHGKPVDWWSLGILIYELHLGIDPFSDDDAMAIYKNILKGKVIFPSSFQKQPKSLIRHLLVTDLSKRFGNLKDGVNDIKRSKWFNSIKWEQLMDKKAKAPYVPSIKYNGDISLFQQHQDSDLLVNQIKKSDDPFINW